MIYFIIIIIIITITITITIIISVIFIVIILYNLIKTGAFVFCTIAWMKKANNFQKAKIWPQGVA